MTVQEAIAQGYEYYIYADGEFQSIKHLSDLLTEGDEYGWERGMELVEKEPYHPANTLDAKEILEIIGDNLQEQHSSESGDDTDGVSEAIQSIDHKILQPLLDEITNKLEGLNYYRSTGIQLTKQ